MAVRKENKQKKEEAKRQLVFSKQKAKSDESGESEQESLENIRSSSGGSNLVESSSDEEFTLPQVNGKVGEYVMVRYDNLLFPGMITEIFHHLKS